MKALFYLLCALNLSLVLWEFHEGRLDSVPVEHVPDGSILTVEEYARAKRGAEINDRIQQRIKRWQQTEAEQMLADLRGEDLQLRPVPTKNKPKPQAVKVEETKPVDPPVVRKCFETGPFEDEASLKKWLGQKALSSKQILQRELITDIDFQVFFPAAKTPEQTRLNKSMLNAKGFQDIWTIPEGDNKGGYSLGVFTEKPRALAFKAQLEAQGIRSEIKQRQKTKPQWFVRVMVDKTAANQYESKALKLTACSNN